VSGLSPDVIAVALFSLALGTAIITQPTKVAMATRNQFWLRSAPRRIFLRFAGIGFVAFGAYAVACMIFPPISIFPGA
jgi:hypothetical protein